VSARATAPEATRTTAEGAIKTDAKWGLESTAKLTVETNAAIGRLPIVITSKSAAVAATERRAGSPAGIGRSAA